jgi:hypothetical protein
MANPTSTIGTRNTTYQTCWECGKAAGGTNTHYYGNFAFGIAHSNCAERIKSILDRSLRALSTFSDSIDDQTKETATRALITTTARKLGNCSLNTIKEDHQIQGIVETEGMTAALAIFRAISNLDDVEWEKRLKSHREIMQEAKPIEEKLPNNKQSAASELEALMNRSFEHRRQCLNECLTLTDQVGDQFQHFFDEAQKGKTQSPYCVLVDIIAPYYHNSSTDALQKFFRALDSLPAWRVVFLAKESQDRTYSYMHHIIVEHVALLPAKTPVAKALEFWKTSCRNEGNQSVSVLPIECLNWKNHWVYVEELRMRLLCGEGTEERPLTSIA